MRTDNYLLKTVQEQQITQVEKIVAGVVYIASSLVLAAVLVGYFA